MIYSKLQRQKNTWPESTFQARQLAKKLKCDIFSGDMRVGKNPFCRTDCAACGGADGATAG